MPHPGRMSTDLERERVQVTPIDKERSIRQAYRHSIDESHIAKRGRKTFTPSTDASCSTTQDQLDALNTNRYQIAYSEQ